MDILDNDIFRSIYNLLVNQRLNQRSTGQLRLIDPQDLHELTTAISSLKINHISNNGRFNSINRTKGRFKCHLCDLYDHFSKDCRYSNNCRKNKKIYKSSNIQNKYKLIKIENKNMITK